MLHFARKEENKRALNGPGKPSIKSKTKAFQLEKKEVKLITEKHILFRLKYC